MEPFVVRFSRRASCLILVCAPLFICGGLFVFVKLSEPGAAETPLALRVLQGVCGALFVCAGVLLSGFGLKNFIRPPAVFTAAPEGLILHGSGALRRVLIPWPEIAVIEKKDVRRPGQTRGMPCITLRLRNAAALRSMSEMDKALKRASYFDEQDEIHFSCFHLSPSADECVKRFNECLALYGSGDAPPPAREKGEHWADTVQRNIAPWVFAVMFIMFLAGGLGLTGAGVWLLARGDASRNWPTAQARVVTSQVVRTEDEDDGPAYYADIRYEYSVKGRKYESDKVFVMNEVYGERETAERIAERYAAGRGVRAHYNPSHPADSVLEPGRNNAFFLLPVFGACAFAVCALLYAKQPRRRPPTAPPV